jgi:hypothetical protein
MRKPETVILAITLFAFLQANLAFGQKSKLSNSKVSTAKTTPGDKVPAPPVLAWDGLINYKMEFANLPPGFNPDMLKGLIPTTMLIAVKSTSLAVRTNASFMNHIVVPGGVDTSFIISKKDGKIYTLAGSDATKIQKENKASKPVITKGKGSKTIAGFLCKEYIATTSVDGKKMVQKFFITDAFRLPQSSAQATQQLGPSELPGTMLGMEATQAGVQVLMEAVSVTPGTPPDSLFAIPAYPHEPFSSALAAMRR